MPLRNNLSKFFIALLLILISSCQKDNIGTITNLNNGVIDVLGHGGSGFTSYTNPFPTNSLNSVRRAIDGYGADGVELDVQLSKDDILILYHDIALESLTDCDGCIRDMNSGDVLQCGYDYDIAFGNEPLIKLEAVFEEYSSTVNPPLIHLDLKSDNYCDTTISPYHIEFADALALIIGRYSAESYVSIISDNRLLLQDLRSALPAMDLYFASSEVNTAFNVLQTDSYTGVCMNNKNVSKDEVSLLHSLGYKVILFGLKSKKSITEALKKHPDAVHTDDIPLCISILY